MDDTAACSCGNILPVSERGAATFPLRTFSLIRLRRAAERNRDS
jgi:hypothetical protein